MKIDAIATPSILTLLLLGVMNEVTEILLCGTEPGMFKCNGGKHSTLWGMNTS